MEKRDRVEDPNIDEAAKRMKLTVDTMGTASGRNKTPERAMPPGLELPSGWIECPPMGHRIQIPKLVPVKVPLGRRFARVLTEDEHFSPEKLVKHLSAKGAQVGLIIDFTNTWRYYDRDEIDDLRVEHLKIPCRGRGQVPDPEAVNSFVWELRSYRQRAGQQTWIVLHCTHGYNRTGYMIVNYLVREGLSVEKALRSFAEHRPPGIYKEDYIRELYRYNHEPLPPGFKAPELPAWKPEEQPDSPGADHILDGEEAAEGSSEPAEMSHDDILGEAVPEEEAMLARTAVVQLVHDITHEVPPDQLRFPGGQPVSLDRANLGKLREKRYWVTWKADGTRYMLLISRFGVYLIDRSFSVRRVQMRFPTALVGKDGLLVQHQMTLLDGEMLVDEDMAAGTQTRRFLAYDLIALNAKSLAHLPFKDRWSLLDEAVMKPRQKERDLILSDLHKGTRNYPARYDYSSELFSVRRKEFYALPRMSYLLERFIPNLSHESDGLIFQPFEEEYVSGTDFNLLKWKFAHMNSVDFRLRSTAAGAELRLLETRRNKPVQGEIPLPGARVAFEEGMDATRLENCIVECAWDAEEGLWRFMRTRSDKDTPNAYHVYEKVMQSIHDNITEEDLHAEIKVALDQPIYAKDVAAAIAAASAGRKQ